MKMTFEEVARIVYEVNRGVRAGLNEPQSASDRPWLGYPEDLKESVRAGVAALAINPHLTPRQMHQLWMNRKLAEGWQYGAVRDDATKVHPDLVPFEELPEGQQLKNHVFSATVKNLLEFVHPVDLDIALRERGLPSVPPEGNASDPTPAENEEPMDAGPDTDNR